MKTIQMRDVLTIINAAGYNARYEMSGGNNGTIYLEVSDDMGDVWLAIGPSNFETGIANSEDLCIARYEEEGGEWNMVSESLIYWDQEQHGEFTAQNIATAVFDQLVPLD